MEDSSIIRDTLTTFNRHALALVLGFPRKGDVCVRDQGSSLSSGFRATYSYSGFVRARYKHGRG